MTAAPAEAAGRDRPDSGRPAVGRSRAGRPRALSRRTLEEAATELFIEQGYPQTSIEQITQRAGVSRATFFNYFQGKSDLLWIDVDEAIDRLAGALAGSTDLRAAIASVAAELPAASVPLAFTQDDVMGTRDEILASGLPRVARLARVLREHLRAADPDADALLTQARAQAMAGALAAGWAAWARAGIGRGPLGGYLDRALTVLA